jgi:Ca2+-transporting ATPase
VSASTVTGNLLVCFNPAHDYRAIAFLVKRVLGSDNPRSQETTAPEKRNPSKGTPAPAAPGAPSKDPGWPAKVKDKISHFLPATEEQKRKPWHRLDGNAILALVDSRRETGLSHKTALERLQRFGPNILPESVPRSKWSIFIDQFKSLPVALLGAAAGLSLFTGGILDAVVIMGVVVANAVVGYSTESEAETTIHSLQRSVRPFAEVLRNGRVIEVPAENVALGDLLILKPGTYVPADCRVLEASHLSIDESSLTGESMPVFKKPRRLRGKKVSLADRVNMVYMGTLVTGGEGVAVVVATGRFTEMGRIQTLLGEAAPPETPIERQLREVGDQLVLLGGGICGIVFLLGFFRGHGWLQMMRLAVSLAAAAVPEGLPAAATVNFSLGIKNMRKHHVLIRHLQAIETLGAVQTVCLDKTGTLTWNKMSITRIHTGMKRIGVENGHFLVEKGTIDPLNVEELRKLIHACALCNETKINGGNGCLELKGSPTENALIDLAIKAGVDVLELRNAFPLLSIDHRAESRLFMCSRHASTNGGDGLYAVKGSPPEVLALCTRQLVNGASIPLAEEARREIEAENDRMAGDALRVLGVAYSNMDKDNERQGNGDLTWLGLVGMLDPVREGARELVEVYHRAGINTVMITGDQSPTAHTVAEQLNLSREEPLEILDSSVLTAVDPAVLEALAKRVHVYARVSPSNKLQIVQALQKAGNVVAMTGDGINDGPALKAADIGIAMGQSGTDVAREVADIVLEEDNLETLVMAVRDGRTTYSNIKKSVHFFLSTNLTEIMVMFAAMAAGLGFPLNVMQLLWINLISDIFPGLALSMEQPEPDVLEAHPRDPREPLFSAREFKKMAVESAAISAGALGAYGYGIARYGMGPRAGSVAFHSLTVGQLLHALICRSETHGLFGGRRLPPNPHLTVAVLGSLVLQALTVLIPGLRRLLGLTPMTVMDAAVIGGSTLLPLAVNEIRKKGEAERT